MKPLVVVGDALLDVDWEGDVRRFCPDEPAPVVESLSEAARPGGAGLAALIAARTFPSRPVVLITALGSDAAGERLRALLSGHVDLMDLGGHRTVTKTRVKAAGRTLLRVDRETYAEPAPATLVPDLTLLRGAAAVLVSDYGLGVSGREDVRAALRGLPDVVWDPHPRGSRPVPGVAIVTPNAGEARHFSTVPGDDLTAAIGQARALVAQWQVDGVTVTRGVQGAVLVTTSGTPMVVPSVDVGAVDACGAGDAFAVALAGGLADGLTVAEGVSRAVIGAGDYLRQGGVAGLREAVLRTVPPAEEPDLVAQVRARGGRVVMAGGCFDLLHAGHVAYLQAARALGDFLVVALNGDESVRRLKGPGRPLVPAADRAQVLRALGCVDAVEIFDEATPEELVRRWRPDIFAKGGDYHESAVPEAPTVHAYGGEVVVLPTLAGRSSTRLVNAARAGARAYPEEEACRTHTA